MTPSLKEVTHEQPSQHCCLFTLILGFLLLVSILPSPSYSMPMGNTDISSGDFAQLQSLVREALKYMHKFNREEPTRISGQVNLRYPRSELGDVAIRLYNLQEMDRKYGAKARPRFGKRNEVTQDNFIPMYGEEELKDSRAGVTGDSVQPPPPLFFIP